MKHRTPLLPPARPALPAGPAKPSPPGRRRKNRALPHDPGGPPCGARAENCLIQRNINTPLGRMVALADRRGLRLLEFADRRELKREIARLKQALRCAVASGANATLDATEVQLRRYFAGKQPVFDLPLAPVGSAFQQAVWAALRRIPEGETRSYGDVAAAIGRAGAMRAVGRASGSNMLCLVIPCHRVIRSDGSLSGYAGGVWRKRRLLDHERSLRAAVP